MSDKKNAVIIAIIKCPFARTGFLIRNREVVWRRGRKYSQMEALQVDDKKWFIARLL